MIQAFLVAFLAVFLAYLSGKEKEHSFFLMLAFAVLTIFLSLGYYWGNDVPTYEERFERYTNSGIALFDFGNYGFLALKELGYVFINILCKPLGFWGMRAILFLIENSIICYFILRHVDRKWYWLATFIYAFNPCFWVLSSSMMRQWLAICIIVLAVDFLLRRKSIVFFLLVLFASTIHITAFVGLVFLPLSYVLKNSNKNTIIIYLIALFLYFVLSPVFISTLADILKEEDMFMGYTSNQGGIGITAVGRMTIYLILLYASLKFNLKDKLLNWIVLLYGFVLPLLSFGELSSRIGFYFTIFTISTYPSYMAIPVQNKNVRTILIGVVCAYLLYSFYLFFTGQTYSAAYYHYRTIPF